MIVEDEAIVAADLKSRLNQLGYQVSGIAASGEQALAMIEQVQPDLVLMDIRLQGVMDGIETALEIRRRFRLPAVFVTAYAGRSTLDRAKLAEPLGYILKPFDNHDLEIAIEIALHKHQTERKLEESEAQHRTMLETAVKDLDDFSYSVSHDLRAPLRAVDGFSHILGDDHAAHLDADGLRLLDVIRHETQRMGQLIDNLLAFSRLGRQRMKMEPIDMRELAQAVFDELAAREPARQLRLELGPLPAAHGSREMIRQVWLHLIGNAIKFTRDREPTEIEIGSKDGPDGWPVYHVRDNGAGFDMRHAKKLFGVFQRLHTQQEFPGSGVGLALVERIVQRHGGRVWAEAQCQRGAVFYFTLSGHDVGQACSCAC